MLLQRMRFLLKKSPSPRIEVSQIHVPPGALKENTGGIITLARRTGVGTLQ